MDRWTTDQVLALAPDAASQRAGSRLAAPTPWTGAGAGDGCVWGLCKGSGSAPYQTVVDLAGPAYRCSCPSRKFPCKHALGLLLLWAGGGVADGARPEWADEWIEARRARAERTVETAAPAPGAAESEAARRRAELRLQRIAAGATDLEQRLADLLRDGLAAAPGAGVWEETAARMVDAQAPGLAARVRELGALPASGAGWPARMLEECALLHLLNRGFLQLDALPEPLAATVRARVGLTMEAAQLLAAGTQRDSWLVLAQEDADDGKLVTRRIWLRGSGSGRMALLLSYGAGGRAPELALPVGLALDADLAYYPGAYPLRAALGERHTPPEQGGQPPGAGLGEAITAYAQALASDPWLEGVPVTLAGVVPIPAAADGPWQLADGDTGQAVPLSPRAGGLWELMAVSGGGPVTVFGELGHEGFRPLTTWTRGMAVAL